MPPRRNIPTPQANCLLVIVYPNPKKKSIVIYNFEIGEKQIDKSINYINTEAEKAAFFAIPKVLKQGIEISEHKNHKGREYDTVTIATKIAINGEYGIVAAVVTKIEGKNKYRVHRVLAPDGSVFVLNETKKIQNLHLANPCQVVASMRPSKLYLIRVYMIQEKKSIVICNILSKKRTSRFL